MSYPEPDAFYVHRPNWLLREIPKKTLDEKAVQQDPTQHTLTEEGLTAFEKPSDKGL